MDQPVHAPLAQQADCYPENVVQDAPPLGRDVLLEDAGIQNGIEVAELSARDHDDIQEKWRCHPANVEQDAVEVKAVEVQVFNAPDTEEDLFSAPDKADDRFFPDEGRGSEEVTQPTDESQGYSPVSRSRPRLETDDFGQLDVTQGSFSPETLQHIVPQLATDDTEEQEGEAVVQLGWKKVGQDVLVLRSNGMWSAGCIAEIDRSLAVTVVFEAPGEGNARYKRIPSKMVNSHVRPAPSGISKGSSSFDVPRCTTSGCSKPTWNGEPNEKCSDSCKPLLIAAPQALWADIRLPASALETRDDSVFFGIEVMPEGGGASWRVLRRYSDFHVLHEHLQSSSSTFCQASRCFGSRPAETPDLLPFPRKYHLGCSGPRLEARRRGLEVWLQQVVANSRSDDSPCVPLQRFLQSSRPKNRGRNAGSPAGSPSPRGRNAGLPTFEVESLLIQWRWGLREENHPWSSPTSLQGALSELAPFDARTKTKKTRRRSGSPNGRSHSVGPSSGEEDGVDDEVLWQPVELKMIEDGNEFVLWLTCKDAVDQLQRYMAQRAIVMEQLCTGGCGRPASVGGITCCDRCYPSEGEEHDPECRQMLARGAPICEPWSVATTRRCADDFGFYRVAGRQEPRTPVLQEAVQQGWIHLLNALYVIALYRGDLRMERQQDLPEEAFARKKWMFSDAGELLVMICVVSCRWLHPTNPDPDGFHLRTLATFLVNFMQARQGLFFGGMDAVLFWDFGSLPQLERSAEDEIRFLKGLNCCDLLYGHELTFVLGQESLPKDFEGVTYKDSGWCFFETCASSINKHRDQTLDMSRFDGSPLNWSDLCKQCSATRRPPRSPDRFDLELDGKVFTAGVDVINVRTLYRRTFHAIAAGCDHIFFVDLGWGPEVVYLLLEVFPYFTKCRALHLNGNPLGEDGSGALLTGMIDEILLPRLDRLELERTGCGKQCKALAEELKLQRPAHLGSGFPNGVFC